MNFGIIGFGKIARKFVQAIEATDEGKIYEIVRHQKYIKEDQLRDQQRILTAHKEDIETQLKEKRAQLEEWQNKKDPEPQLSEEVYKNIRLRQFHFTKRLILRID